MLPDSDGGDNLPNSERRLDLNDYRTGGKVFSCSDWQSVPLSRIDRHRPLFAPHRLFRHRHRQRFSPHQLRHRLYLPTSSSLPIVLSSHSLLSPSPSPSTTGVSLPFSHPALRAIGSRRCSLYRPLIFGLSSSPYPPSTSDGCHFPHSCVLSSLPLSRQPPFPPCAWSPSPPSTTPFPCSNIVSVALSLSLPTSSVRLSHQPPTTAAISLTLASSPPSPSLSLFAAAIPSLCLVLPLSLIHEPHSPAPALSPLLSPSLSPPALSASLIDPDRGIHFNNSQWG